MITIYVGAPAKSGFYPYRIDGHWGPDGAPLIGIAEDPVAEASRVLEALGVNLGTRIRIEAPKTRLGAIHATGLLENFLRKTVNVLPTTQPKALPPPRRRPRKGLRPMGSGIPGDF